MSSGKNLFEGTAVDVTSIFVIHNSLGFTSWLWWFISTQFIVFWFLKRDSIPDSNLIIVSLRSTIQVWFFQSYANWSGFNSIQLYHDIHGIFLKMLQIHPLWTFALSPPNLLSKSAAKQTVIWCCWHFKELHWFSMRQIKINLLPVSLWQLNRFSLSSEQRSRLDYFLSYFCDEERKFTASSAWFMGFLPCFPDSKHLT